jgi:hypothetical protein
MEVKIYKQIMTTNNSAKKREKNEIPNREREIVQNANVIL